jgi:hypothetical protein
LITFTIQIKQTMIKIHLNYFLGSLLCLGIAIGLATGKVQENIHFAGEINEIAEFALSGTLGILLLFASIERIKKDQDGK